VRQCRRILEKLSAALRASGVSVYLPDADRTCRPVGRSYRHAIGR
jgi:hypothetical protein